MKLKNDSLRISVSKKGFVQIWPKNLKEFPLEFSRFLGRCGLSKKAAQEVVARLLDASKASHIAIEVPVLTNALTRKTLRGASLEYANRQGDDETRVPSGGPRDTSTTTGPDKIRVSFDHSQNPLEAEISGDAASIIDFLKAMRSEGIT